MYRVFLKNKSALCTFLLIFFPRRKPLLRKFCGILSSTATDVFPNGTNQRNLSSDHIFFMCRWCLCHFAFKRNSSYISGLPQFFFLTLLIDIDPFQHRILAGAAPRTFFFNNSSVFALFALHAFSIANNGKWGIIKLLASCKISMILRRVLSCYQFNKCF